MKIFQTFQFGSNKFAIKIDAQGIVDGKLSFYESSIRGQEEGHVTALVAAKVAEHLCTFSLPSGVFQIEQLFEPLEFIKTLSDSNLIFSHSELRSTLSNSNKS